MSYRNRRSSNSPARPTTMPADRLAEIKTQILQVIDRVVDTWRAWPETQEKPMTEFVQGGKNTIKIAGVECRYYYDEPSLTWKGFIATTLIDSRVDVSAVLKYHFIDITWNGQAYPEVKCTSLEEGRYINESIESRKRLVHAGYHFKGKMHWFFLNREKVAKHWCPKCHWRAVKNEGDTCLHCQTSLSYQEIEQRAKEKRIRDGSKVLPNGAVLYFKGWKQNGKVAVYCLLSGTEPAEGIGDYVATGSFGHSIDRYQSEFDGRQVPMYEVTCWAD